MEIQITKSLINQVSTLISEKRESELVTIFSKLHAKDISEILYEFDSKETAYVLEILNYELSSEVLVELEDDRRKVLEFLPPKEIADNINEIFSDDAADVLSDLSEEKAREVLERIEDRDQAKDIQELLNYQEDTAGGLMEKELVRVRKSWTVLHCVKEMRSQAENVGKVYVIYVVDDQDILVGTLSLKKLLTVPTREKIANVYKANVRSVPVTMKAEELASFMQKYDVFVVPVVDRIGRLVGRVTIDDIVDVIKEEADRDYQLASGISMDVDSRDSIWELARARLPWLILGLFGGIGAARIMGGFETALESFVELFFFTPLVAAMAGNVGVQSSAIIVQSLANDTFQSSMWSRLQKEFYLSFFNGIILSFLVVLFGYFMKYDWTLSLAISISLFVVIIFASLIGTIVPLILDKKGIDPAIATGPFITTSNDIFGILIYFLISKMILGF